MAPRKPQPRPGLFKRTSLAELTAAGAGLVLTLGVIGVSLWEGFSGEGGPPSLSVRHEPPRATDGGFLVPIKVRNDSRATAASVEVRGMLEAGGRVLEERRAVFGYVPGRGEVEGGLLFERDPGGLTLRIAPEGYEIP